MFAAVYPANVDKAVPKAAASLFATASMIAWFGPARTATCATKALSLVKFADVISDF